MNNQYVQEIKTIIQLAKNYSEKHQIIYSDYHERMVLMVIGETIKLASNSIKTTYDMDIYKDQIPLKDDDSIEVYQ
jgi:hypothetical protein